MVVRYTKPSDFASGDAFAKALLTPEYRGATFFGAVQDDMRFALKQELPKLDQGEQWPAPERPGEPPLWEYVEVSRIRRKRWKGLPYYLLDEMDLGSTANWYADQTGVDLWPILEELREMARKLSPRRKSGGQPSSPSYRDAHSIFYGGNKIVSRPAEQPPEALGMITNLTEYASTLETPDFALKGMSQKYQTYQRLFRYAKRKYANTVDIMLVFGNPDAFGGHTYTKSWARRKRPVYAVPVLVVAPLNLLPASQRSQLNAKFRRALTGPKNKVRYNVRALFRRRLRGLDY